MRVSELDLLRFIAALAVVFFHYVAWFVVDQPQLNTILEPVETVTRFGYLGVPLFFMISGFVILASAMQRNSIDFVVSRIVRLYPVYWLSVSLTVAVLILWGSDSQIISFKQYIVNLSMLQSYVGVTNLDGVYWTLAKEIQFYACIFLLLSFGLLNSVRSWLSIWLLITLTFHLFKQPFFMGWFITPEYSPFFIAGVCFYMIRAEKHVGYFSAMALLALLLSCNSVFTLSEQFIPNIDGRDRWISVLIICFFYILFWLIAKKKMIIKSSPILIALGVLTYPLYLIHNMVGKVFLSKLNLLIGPEMSIVFVVILMLSISHLISRYYETIFSYSLRVALTKIIKKLPFINNTDREVKII